MIVELAEDFVERVEAADFVFRVARPDLSTEARRFQALRYAQAPGPDHGVLSVDVDPCARMTVRPGGAENPIYVARDGGLLVGAVICSCVVPDLPVRIMGHAVSREFRGRGLAPALVRHVIAQHAVVGGAVNVDRKGLRNYASRLGFVHWHDTPDPNVAVGFTQPIDPVEGMRFAVPIASKLDIARAEAKMRMDRQAEPRKAPARFATFKRIA